MISLRGVCSTSGGWSSPFITCQGAIPTALFSSGTSSSPTVALFGLLFSFGLGVGLFENGLVGHDLTLQILLDIRHTLLIMHLRDNRRCIGAHRTATLCRQCTKLLVLLLLGLEVTIVLHCCIPSVRTTLLIADQMRIDLHRIEQ